MRKNTTTYGDNCRRCNAIEDWEAYRLGMATAYADYVEHLDSCSFPSPPWTDEKREVIERNERVQRRLVQAMRVAADVSYGVAAENRCAKAYYQPITREMYHVWHSSPHYSRLPGNFEGNFR